MVRMIINTLGHLSQVIITENKELLDYFIEDKSDKDNLGNIYMGRVEQIIVGMDAAFINIGEEKNALLHNVDILPNPDKLPINKLIKQGQEIIVQVKKVAIGDKGARVSMKLSISGNFLILLPNEKKVFISKKIIDTNIASKLKKYINNIKPNMGVIIRTEAQGVDEDTISREMQHLVNKLKKLNNFEKAPKLLLRDENIIFKSIRDYYTEEIEEIVCNDINVMLELKEYFGIRYPLDIGKIKIIDNIKLKEYSITGQINNLYKRKLWLQSGGYIIIDYTEAFTVIDINSGKFTGKKNFSETSLSINLEATELIANQLRLRNISGIILIDYINIKSKEYQNIILEKWAEKISKDKITTKIHGFTELSILQITRKQQGKSLHQKNHILCPLCEGTGFIEDESSNVLFNKS